MTTPGSRSTVFHQRGSTLTDFLKRHFKSTKLIRAYFREHSLHLQGMFSERSSDEVFAGWSEGAPAAASGA